MPTLKFGFSATPDGTGSFDGFAFPSFAKERTLEDGDLVASTSLTIAENTGSSSTTLWQASGHGASPAEAPASIAICQVDPLTSEETPIPLGIMASYTTSGAATVTDTVFQQTYPSTPLCFEGTVRLSNGDLAYLTKLAARNRNTGTDDAIKVTTSVWK
jgi:hypothetical protein